MSNKLILVEENIFTEDIAILHNELNKSIDTLNINNLISGIERDDYLDTIKKLRDISDALKDLSNKRFQDVKVNTIFFR
jgi:hypothetical protein